ncbi:hypothetical protein D3C73_1674840 [compost metagenome]
MHRFGIVLDELLREVVEGCSCRSAESGICCVEQLNQPGVISQLIERRMDADDIDVALLVGL